MQFVVDTGLVHSLVPEVAWRTLGLQPLRTQSFVLADGTLLQRDVGECEIDLADLGRTTTTVILGRPGDVTLLSARTLDALGLVLHPFNRTLMPLHGPGPDRTTA